MGQQRRLRRERADDTKTVSYMPIAQFVFRFSLNGDRARMKVRLNRRLLAGQSKLSIYQVHLLHSRRRLVGTPESQFPSSPCRLTAATAHLLSHSFYYANGTRVRDGEVCEAGPCPGKKKCPMPTYHCLYNTD